MAGKPQGFNALPGGARGHRRRSSVEEELLKIMSATAALGERNVDVRMKQREVLDTTDKIIKRCDAIVGAYSVTAAMKAGKKWTGMTKLEEARAKVEKEEDSTAIVHDSTAIFHPRVSQKEDAEKAALLRREDERAAMMADLAKLQATVSKAKQSAAMEMFHQVATGIIYGKNAQLFLVWRQNVFGAVLHFGDDEPKANAGDDEYSCEIDEND